MGKGYLSLNGALNLLLHAPGSSLKMYVSGGRREYFVVPNGGMVEEKHALAIIARPEIGPFEDGLFPGNPQSWRRRTEPAARPAAPMFSRMMADGRSDSAMTRRDRFARVERPRR